MKPVYIVQVTFTGKAAEMNAEAQARFNTWYNTNGMLEARRTKAAAEKLLLEWERMGQASMREFRRAESAEEVLFAIIGAAAPAGARP